MLRQVFAASGLARKRWTLLFVLTGVLAFAGTAIAAGVTFDGGPGTGKPPTKFHSLKMKRFAKDNRPKGGQVSSVHGPTGDVRFSSPVFHLVVKNVDKRGFWKTWSNGYHGDVYFLQGPSLTLTLPPKTKAFYLYGEPNVHKSFTMTASSGGASSGPIRVHGNAGAHFFGFVAKGGSLSTVTVTSTDQGFAVGEFGIHKGK
jgi:hypothetical protein